MSRGELRIGLLGASRVATYAIIEPARSMPGVRVHGVAARDPERAGRYASEQGIKHVYGSYQDLLDDPEIGLVYVGTPPANHEGQALAAIAAGKATLVEKPFALNAAGARRVLDAAREAGVAVFEAMHSPHHALFARVLALIAQGRIGRVRHVIAVFDAPIDPGDPIRWSAALGGGALMDLGVYPLAWVRRICGEDFTVEVAEAEMRGDVDASFSATLRFDGGTTAIVSSSMCPDQPAARLRLEGDCGHILVHNPLAPQIGHALMITADGETKTETLGGPSTYQAQLAAVRAAVLGEDAYPFPPDDFVRSMEAVDRVRVSWAPARADCCSRPEAHLLPIRLDPHTPVQRSEKPLRYEVPATVSPQAKVALEQIYGFLQQVAAAPRSAPVTMADWDARNAMVSAMIGPMVTAAADSLGVTLQEDVIGGVPVLRIRPPGHTPRDRTLIYAHGGGYVLFSARTSLTVPALMAVASGDEVISVDYTVAPRGNWRTATDEVIAVYEDVVTRLSPAQVGLLGDSAGGGLVAGAVLKMRDQQVSLPGALYLLSPWADITDAGDTYTTLAAADPSLGVESLRWGADAYADPADQKHPYVSPVYADYEQPFPPTLIQGGTREIFVSHFVRLYQAIRGGGHEAVLDLYEGMPHVFQALAPAIPETTASIKRAAAFFDAHLAER